jgi:RluA family pseudouridine synthase
MRVLTTTVPPGSHGQRLDDFSVAWLSHALERELSRSAVRRLIMAGAVHVAGAAARRPGMPLAAGQRIMARLRLDALAPAQRDTSGAIDSGSVLFEDAWLIALDKPAGLPFHETADRSRPDLVSALRRFLAARPGAKPEAYVGVHQRLDRETSGVVLFAKHPDANAGLAAAFGGRQVRKIYHALTLRPAQLPPAKWSVAGQLALVGRGRGARMGAVPSGGRESHTDFALLETFETALLIEARPRTGRKHQIRAHLAGQGLAILGDSRYSAGSAAHSVAPRLMLHARRLELRHPVTGAELVIESPYPAELAQALATLRLGRSRAASARRSAPASTRRRHR